MESILRNTKKCVVLLFVFGLSASLSTMAQSTPQKDNSINIQSNLEAEKLNRAKKIEPLLPYENYQGINHLDQAKMTWVSENDREYRAMLPERDDERTDGNASENVPVNDLCANALPITCGSSVSGTTIGSTFDNVGFCGTSNTTGGVWYTFTATDPLIELSTCNSANYDTKISVFSGSCNALVCEAGIDDAAGCSGFTTRLEFTATVGQQYWVLVHGFASATGTFTLSLDCKPAAVNDICSAAIPIQCGQTIAGSTSTASADLAPGNCGTSITTSGVWYSFVATGSASVLSTCNDADYDTKISVFSGTCSSLNCVGGQDDNFIAGCQNFTTELTVATTPGEKYYVYVHGYAQNKGDFNLTLSNACGFCSPTDGTVSANPGTPVSPGGAANTLYIGYGPSSVDLTAMGSGGSGSYSYAWTSPNGTLSASSGGTVTASPTVTETYSVIISDNNGCGAVTRDITINVVDVRCGKKNDKILVCKVPPGNPGNVHNICVSPNAVASHLATGSYLGSCTNKQQLAGTSTDLTLYPNPTKGHINVEFELSITDELYLQVYDSFGRLVYEEEFVENTGTYLHQINVSNLSNGVYLLRLNGSTVNQSSRFTISQ